MQKTVRNNHRMRSSNADVSHSRRIGEIGRCKVRRSICCTYFLPCTGDSESRGSDACNEIGPCIDQTGKKCEWSCEAILRYGPGNVVSGTSPTGLVRIPRRGRRQPFNSRDCREHAKYSRECVATYLSEGRCAFSQARCAPPCTLLRKHLHKHAHTHRDGETHVRCSHACCLGLSVVKGLSQSDFDRQAFDRKTGLMRRRSYTQFCRLMRCRDMRDASIEMGTAFTARMSIALGSSRF